MNSVTSSLNLSAGPATPPLPGLRERLARLGTAVWQALAASGHARAQWHLREFADRCEAQQPELAKERRAAASKPPHA